MTERYQRIAGIVFGILSILASGFFPLGFLFGILGLIFANVRSGSDRSALGTLGTRLSLTGLALTIAIVIYLAFFGGLQAFGGSP